MLITLANRGLHLVVLTVFKLAQEVLMPNFGGFKDLEVIFEPPAIMKILLFLMPMIMQRFPLSVYLLLPMLPNLFRLIKLP